MGSKACIYNLSQTVKTENNERHNKSEFALLVENKVSETQKKLINKAAISVCCINQG
jgi:hypothetical protein